MSFGSDTTTQHLKPIAGEQFLGGGMQNGRVVHTGSTINISNNFNWADGGHPNAAPYYMTSAGYGVLRNTFAPGSYTFTENETTTHREKRFDAYYFVGDYKRSLGGYTKLTGRPNLPRYIYKYPDTRGLVARFGMTVLPCHLMIRGVLSPGLEILVDR